MGDRDVQAFLAECKESGDKAYGAFKGLLQRLLDVETRLEARVFFERIETHVNAELPIADTLAEFHFRIHELSLTEFQGLQETRQKLKLLELPSIFIPEDWSFTFLEGLNRHPESGFQDRDVVELGCGNGWISIALAERWSPRKVYGLDINPRAIKVAQINLYLNALDGDGSPVLDHEGKTLLDRVEFHESDLLGYCSDRNIMLDRIVGCIPQVCLR
jgi:methionine S-methyltransferase